MKIGQFLFFVSFVGLMFYNTDALADKLLCPAGKMVPANFEYCIDCTDENLGKHLPEDMDKANVLCAGGIFDFNVPKIQGIKYCSDNKKPDAGHTKCEEIKVAETDSESEVVETETIVEETTVVEQVGPAIQNEPHFMPAPIAVEEVEEVEEVVEVPQPTVDPSARTIVETLETTTVETEYFQ